MSTYTSKTQLIEASDEEIFNFFANAVFEGIFSNEIRSKQIEKNKGHIHSITLNGENVNFMPAYLNVPRSSKSVPEGRCSFMCRINIDALRTDQPFFINMVEGSLTSIDSSHSPTPSSYAREQVQPAKIEQAKQYLLEAWGVEDCTCIGYYYYNEETGKYVVDDLRKPNFDHIPYYPGDKNKRPIRLRMPFEIRGIRLNDYYLFTWKLSHRNPNNPFEIFIDFSSPACQPRAINPKWFINKLFDDRHNDKSKNFGSATNFLDTLSKQLSAKESTFIYELLQNANDYPVEGQMVDVEFHITDRYLLFLHSGEKFNVRNISGICGINEKEKSANKKAIGYKGIGFKTVFLNNQYVYIRTGNYSFRFDKKAKKIKRLEAPWPILPVWTEYNEVDTEVNQVFDNAGEKFRVELALRPDNAYILHRGRNNYATLLKDVFEDSNIILFIPNINSVRVVIDGKEERICYRNNDEWVVGDYEQDIDVDLQAAINKTIEKGNSRIPEKYKDFDCTKVSFACKHRGAIIQPMEKATLYCYLPTKASWGLPFLMNTDMIPKGDRNDIETEVALLDENETNFNEELAAIAGGELFSWIKDLLISKRYHLGSVFSLIPNFEKCKKEHGDYEQFIERFEKDFDNRIDSEQIIPVPHGIANINDVIYDKTGITSSGIMTDEEFLKFSEHDDAFLPLPLLRKDKHFNAFMKRYANEDYIFDDDSLHTMVKNNDFREWLKDQENNNKFLKFLTDNDYLEDFVGEEVFLGIDGELYAASDLYYDIDEYLEDLHAFEEDYLNHLSFETRSFFKDDEKWETAIKGEFIQFDCNSFVDDTLLSNGNISGTIKTLNDKEASILFYKFLAENVGYAERYKQLPFFDDEDNICNDFEEDFIFFSSQEGHNVCDSAWLSEVETFFISKDYGNRTIEYFKKNFGVREFSDKIIIDEIILSGDFKEAVSNGINEDFEVGKGFITYCYAHKELFKENSLKDYSLKVYDCDGDEGWYLAEDNIYFASPTFDAYSEKKWINADWMASLDRGYFDNDTGLKGFIHRTFGVDELTDKEFYKDVVKKNLKDIIGNTSGSADSDGSKNFDFVRYLDDNYTLIFTECKDGDVFSKLVIISKEGYDVDVSTKNLYIFDEKLEELVNSQWFPDDIVTLCHSDYGNSKALASIGVKLFEFRDFFDDVIVENLDAINDTADTVEKSVAFHNYIIGNLLSLTTGQQEKMRNANVFLYGYDEPVTKAGGHKTLSKKAKELFDYGLVDFAEMDLIDPAYKTDTNTEYWETRLGNIKFTVNHFFAWLKDNVATFSETLQDKDINITFWRWVKDNTSSDKNIEDLPLLPIILKDGSINDSGNPVYFSNEYINGAGIETILRDYDEGALFISTDYINEGDRSEEWFEFWKKIGVKYEIVDILTETVIPRLSEINDEHLVRLLADNREALEKQYEDGLIPHITDLRVRARDGKFYNIADTVYVDCEKEEPFAYIVIPNQISFDMADERRLAKDIIDELGNDCIERLSEWRQRKVDCYLNMQEDNIDYVRDIHFKFINDLASIRNNREEPTSLERMEEVMLLDRNEVFCDAASLTMGSIYKPFFDFEKCGVETEYVSNDYETECKEYVGRLFRTMKVRSDLSEDDLELLTNRDCAVYFWSEYMTAKSDSRTTVDRVFGFIREGLLSDLACIPTVNGVKKPYELYYGYEVNSFVKSIEDYEEKIPLTSLPDIEHNEDNLFNGLPFRKSLAFEDALYALTSRTGQDSRRQLLKWMIDDYKEDEHDELVKSYREDDGALWYNNKNERVHISTLYAVDNSDKKLEQYFGKLPRIINEAYFPVGDDFRKACDILGITTIDADELQMEPVDDVVYSDRNNDLRLFALVIAGYVDSDNWKVKYYEFMNELNALTLHKCSSISIAYKHDKEINQSLNKFYHEDGTYDFYFVDSLDSKRVFKEFVKEYIAFIGLTDKDIDQDMVEDIMDSTDNAKEHIVDHNDWLINEEFMNELRALNVDGVQEMKGIRAEGEDRDNYPTMRPSFTTRNVSNANGEGEEDEVSEGDEGYPTPEDEIDANRKESHGETSATGHPTSTPTNPQMATRQDSPSTQPTASAPESSKGNVPEVRHGDEYVQVDDGDDDASTPTSSGTPETPTPSSNAGVGEYNPDGSGYMGQVTGNNNYQPLGERPHRPFVRKHPKHYTKEELKRLSSQGTPLELESLPETAEEIDLLAQCDIKPEQIADTNYLAQLRLYQNLCERGEEPEETLNEFVHNADDVASHRMKNGKYIHSCSAARGVMYISPSVWNKMIDNQWEICVYLDGKGKNFHYIKDKDEFLALVEKDDVVIKITGKEKVEVVKALYSGLLKDVKGTAYTLIRVASRTNMDAVFAHYVGAMAEADDGNEDINEY